MSQPTKAEWDAIAEQLDRQYSTVYLRCDGYLVSATMKRTGPNKLAIWVSVNGWDFRGGWLPEWDGSRPMSEEARRFWRPRKCARMSAKNLKLWEMLDGKRECRRRGYYEPVIRPTPEWLRPRPLIAHLRKNNTSIEILDYATYAAELEALRAREPADG